MGRPAFKKLGQLIHLESLQGEQVGMAVFRNLVFPPPPPFQFIICYTAHFAICSSQTIHRISPVCLNTAVLPKTISLINIPISAA